MSQSIRRQLSLPPGPWMIAAAATLWGTSGTAQALAPAGAQPLVVGTLRLVVGAVGLLALAGLRRSLPTLRTWRSWPPGATLLAAISIAAYQLCFFAAVARTGVAVGTIVGIGSAPIAGGITGYLLRGERPGRRWMLATLLAVAGCALLALSGGEITVDVLGIVLALGAGFTYALYAALSKRLLDVQPPTSVTAVTLTLGALLLLPILFVYDLRWMVEPRGVLVPLHLGLITVTLAYTLFTQGLRVTPVATTATLTLAEPLTAGLLGVFVLGEQLTSSALVGISLMLAGLVVLTIPAKTWRRIGWRAYALRRSDSRY